MLKRVALLFTVALAACSDDPTGMERLGDRPASFALHSVNAVDWQNPSGTLELSGDQWRAEISYSTPAGVRTVREGGTYSLTRDRDQITFQVAGELPRLGILRGDTLIAPLPTTGRWLRVR